jgi:predicted HTH domain antitoxin
MDTVSVTVQFPRDLLAALNLSHVEAGRKTLEWIALQLFLEGEISAGKGAEMLGVNKSAFIDLLHRRDLPYLDAAPGELESEIAAALQAAE